HPPETMAIIVLVAFENGICPGETHRSDNQHYGTKIAGRASGGWQEPLRTYPGTFRRMPGM
ncbi:hypothetical protein, partial [Rhizobium sp. Leaf341]|uniref:hypothetical protein n=1 Tax=Rhizobium sp. Leaf341 TaxID=1736344 RepID=UPI001AEC4C1A